MWSFSFCRLSKKLGMKRYFGTKLLFHTKGFSGLRSQAATQPTLPWPADPAFPTNMNGKTLLPMRGPHLHIRSSKSTADDCCLAYNTWGYPSPAGAWSGLLALRDRRLSLSRLVGSTLEVPICPLIDATLPQQRIGVGGRIAHGHWISLYVLSRFRKAWGLGWFDGTADVPSASLMKQGSRRWKAMEVPCISPES